VSLKVETNLKMIIIGIQNYSIVQYMNVPGSQLNKADTAMRRTETGATDFMQGADQVLPQFRSMLYRRSVAEVLSMQNNLGSTIERMLSNQITDRPQG